MIVSPFSAASARTGTESSCSKARHDDKQRNVWDEDVIYQILQYIHRD